MSYNKAVTTLTVTKQDKNLYESLRSRANKAFRDKYNLKDVYSVKLFFGVMVDYLENNQEEIIKHAIEPRNTSKLIEIIENT